MLVGDVLFVGERDGDRRHFGFGGAHPLRDRRRHRVAVVVGIEVEAVSAGVDIGVLAGAGDRHIGPFAGGVLCTDHMAALDGRALGGERVLHIGQPGLRRVEQLAVKHAVATVAECQGRVGTVGVNVEDVGGAAVADASQLGVSDGMADLNLITRPQAVGAAGQRHFVL